jgi:hypothetical protein
VFVLESYLNGRRSSFAILVNSQSPLLVKRRIIQVKAGFTTGPCKAGNHVDFNLVAIEIAQYVIKVPRLAIIFTKLLLLSKQAQTTLGSQKARTKDIIALPYNST